MKIKTTLLVLLCFSFAGAQSEWPSESWMSAQSLTSVMNANGLTELSGLHWNPESNRLYVVHGDGRLRVLQLNTATNNFTQIGNRTLPDGPEGITQVDYAANEFYTIDENNYEIRKFTHTSNFSSVTETRHWNLLAPPSPMQDTGNNGPEGIVFVPDSALSEIGFVSEQTELPYTSLKGMGGLLFVAHQDGGYIWVFDVNPNVNNDFAYVGKYRTNRSESCDLSFDRSTGLLYILHNIDDNYIEVTDLSLNTEVAAEATFTTVNEYYVSNPTDGNVNIEGFAITGKCPDENSVSAFLCRDVEIAEPTPIAQDAIRWFNPYVADGNCNPLSTPNSKDNFPDLSIYPNPGFETVNISSGTGNFSAVWINAMGQTIFTKSGSSNNTIDVSSLPSGIYIIEVQQVQQFARIKWIKE